MDDNQKQQSGISNQGSVNNVHGVGDSGQALAKSDQPADIDSRQEGNSADGLGSVHQSSPQQNQIQQPQVSSQPVSTPHKEIAPPLRSEQHIKPTEQTIELSNELREAGVEHAPDVERPELSPDVKQAGVTYAKEHVELDPIVPPMVQLPPYKREEVLPHAQKGPVTDAARWFYTFLIRQIDKVKKQNLQQK